MARPFYVYILASDTRELYVGVTNNLYRRIREHRDGTDPYARAFRHATARLVRVEEAGAAYDAIRREKQLKGWTRRRKVELIERDNPRWQDLAARW